MLDKRTQEDTLTWLYGRRWRSRPRTSARSRTWSWRETWARRCRRSRLAWAPARSTCRTDPSRPPAQQEPNTQHIRVTSSQRIVHINATLSYTVVDRYCNSDFGTLHSHNWPSIQAPRAIDSTIYIIHQEPFSGLFTGQAGGYNKQRFDPPLKGLHATNEYEESKNVLHQDLLFLFFYLSFGM